MEFALLKSAAPPLAPSPHPYAPLNPSVPFEGEFPPEGGVTPPEVTPYCHLLPCPPLPVPEFPPPAPPPPAPKILPPPCPPLPQPAPCPPPPPAPPPNSAAVPPPQVFPPLPPCPPIVCPAVEPIILGSPPARPESFSVPFTPDVPAEAKPPPPAPPPP